MFTQNGKIKCPIRAYFLTSLINIVPFVDYFTLLIELLYIGRYYVLHNTLLALIFVV